MNRSFVNDILHGRTISSFSSPTNKISIISLKHSTFWTDFAKPTGSVCWAAFTQKMSDGLLGSGKLTLIFGISSPVFQRLQLIFNYEPQDLKIRWQSLHCIPICFKPWPLQHQPCKNQLDYQKSPKSISFSFILWVLFQVHQFENFASMIQPIKKGQQCTQQTTTKFIFGKKVMKESLD